MRKKYLLLAAVLCLSMTAFVGCGNKDNNNGSQATASPSADDAGGSQGSGDDSVMDDVENGVDDVIDGTEDAVDDVMDGTDDVTGNGTDDTNNTGNKDDDKNNSVTSGKKDKETTGR